MQTNTKPSTVMPAIQSHVEKFLLLEPYDTVATLLHKATAPAPRKVTTEMITKEKNTIIEATVTIAMITK